MLVSKIVTLLTNIPIALSNTPIFLCVIAIAQTNTPIFLCVIAIVLLVPMLRLGMPWLKLCFLNGGRAS
jgi:hypothetical protein